jgi:hypothetical protein
LNRAEAESLNQQPPRPLIGVNLPWLGGAYGHDLGPNLAYPRWPVGYDPNATRKTLDVLGSLGIRVIRFWLFEQGEGLIYGKGGWVEGVAPTFLANLGDFAGALADRGFRTYWTLFDANSVFRHGDGITRSILVDPKRAGSFCRNALERVLPLIEPSAWAIDLCNEVEAMIAGRDGNGGEEGTSWDAILAPIEVMASHFRSAAPGIPLSLGSGFQEHRNHASGRYARFQQLLSIIDFHTYAPGGWLEPASTIRSTCGADARVVVGEMGCEVPHDGRRSLEHWKAAQDDLTRKVHRLADSGYDAAFLWYLSDLSDRDATALVFRGEVGLGLHNVHHLIRGGAIRSE